MPWALKVYPTAPADDPDCTANGCNGLARHHVLAVLTSADGVVLSTKHGRLCDEHLAAARAKAPSSASQPIPAPAPSPEDLTPAMAAPKAEGPKRAPKIYPLPSVTPSVCSSCLDAIHWIVTDAGRPMPIDAFGEKAGQSHFITCPQRDQHRKRVDSATTRV